MLSFEEFRKSSRCKPLKLEPEDEPQDKKDWDRLKGEDEKRQYEEYLVLIGEKEPVKALVIQRGSGVKFDRTAYQREYMREWRARQKK